MHDRDNDELVGRDGYDELVRESQDGESTNVFEVFEPGDGCTRNSASTSEVDGSVDCVEELFSEPGSLFVVPLGGFERFESCGWIEANRTAHL
nr:hypothetical protein [Ilumatobacter nonamiensis]